MNNKIDLSMFSARDAFEIGLQRTGHLKSHLGFLLWTKGRPELLRLEASFRKRIIIAGAMRDAQLEFGPIADYLSSQPLRRMIDIGCGHGLIDLLFFRKYGCQLHLVDIETSVTHYHGFHEAGAGYASLAAATRFLVGNGVPSSSIQTTNPGRTKLMDSGCDLIISLLSCGFHYPARTYGQFINAALRPDGLFIFDMRKNTAQEDFLLDFTCPNVLVDAAKYQRIAVRRTNFATNAPC